MSAFVGFQSSRTVPRQRLLWQSVRELLFGHMTQHYIARRRPPLKCLLYAAAICALAPSTAGLRDVAYGIGGRGHIGDDFAPPPLSSALHNPSPGPGPPQSLSHPRSIDTNSVVEAYQSYHNPTSVYEEVENGGLGLQELSQSHELDLDPDLENVGGGFALTRAMTETLSEYNFPSSMPSPRLGVR